MTPFYITPQPPNPGRRRRSVNDCRLPQEEDDVLTCYNVFADQISRSCRRLNSGGGNPYQVVVPARTLRRSPKGTAGLHCICGRWCRTASAGLTAPADLCVTLNRRPGLPFASGSGRAGRRFPHTAWGRCVRPKDSRGRSRQPAWGRQACVGTMVRKGWCRRPNLPPAGFLCGTNANSTSCRPKEAAPGWPRPRLVVGRSGHQPPQNNSAEQHYAEQTGITRYGPF